MCWVVKHKSGTVLFRTDNIETARDRKRAGWRVEMDKSRYQFEEWIEKETGFDSCRTNYSMIKDEDQQYKDHQTNIAWFAWQASRDALLLDDAGE